MLSTTIEQTRELCAESLRGEDLHPVAEALKRAGINDEQCVRLVHSVDGSLGSQEPVGRLKASVAESGANLKDGSLERFLLIQSALRALDAIPALPVNISVQRNFCDAFRLFTDPPKAAKPKLLAGNSSFGAMCRIASLRRFPAGEFEWEISGLPRSWLLRVDRRSLPKVLYLVGVKMKGFAPIFFPHLGVLRPKRIVLLESLVNQSYYQMATSIALQPAVKGLVTSSWFYSPEIGQVSPHLTWLGKFFLENGGFVTCMGATHSSGGALSRSVKRRRMYESGEYRPTAGLVIWPRKAMLEWAAKHPELDT